MAKQDYPVGKAQQMVLDALGMSATGFSNANEQFAAIGIRVSSKRQGRTSVPVVEEVGSFGGGFNRYGEGESWGSRKASVDLTPVRQWMAK